MASVDGEVHGSDESSCRSCTSLVVSVKLVSLLVEHLVTLRLFATKVRCSPPIERKEKDHMVFGFSSYPVLFSGRRQICKGVYGHVVSACRCNERRTKCARALLSRLVYVLDCSLLLLASVPLSRGARAHVSLCSCVRFLLI